MYGSGSASGFDMKKNTETNGGSTEGLIIIFHRCKTNTQCPLTKKTPEYDSWTRIIALRTPKSFAVIAAGEGTRNTTTRFIGLSEDLMKKVGKRLKLLF